jgi:hypothetical protein
MTFSARQRRSPRSIGTAGRSARRFDGVFVLVVRQETEQTDTVMGAAVLVVWLLCLVPAGRSLLARVVADTDGMTVHNALRTVRWRGPMSKTST